MDALDGELVGGSEPIGLGAPGDHVCSVVDRPEQLPARVVAWARRGLDAGERVVYVDLPRHPRFLGWLEDSGLAWTPAVADGRLVVLPPDAAYLVDGVFDVDRRLAQHAAFVEQSLAEGYGAVRMAAEATVVLGAFPDLDSVLAYERGFEALCRRLPVSGLCIYDRLEFGDELAVFARAHPRAVADDQFQGTVRENRVRLAGELDASNADLPAALVAEPADGRDLVVDVHGVTFIDVAATATLVEAARRWAPTARATLLGPSPQLRTIVSVAGWGDAFDLVDIGAGA